MNSLNFVLLFLLILALILSLFKTGARARWAKNIRFFIVILGLAFFGYWFFQKSFSNFLEKSMSIQVINRVNQPLDIYAIKVIDKDQNKFLTKHLGKVRTHHYQIDYFVMSNSNEFWVAAYNIKNKLVYFSQHSVQNKEEDQKIEVRTFLNQSQKLSDIAEKVIEKNKLKNINKSILVSLSLLLLFLNVVLLTRKK